MPSFSTTYLSEARFLKNIFQPKNITADMRIQLAFTNMNIKEICKKMWYNGTVLTAFFVLFWKIKLFFIKIGNDVPL